MLRGHRYEEKVKISQPSLRETQDKRPLDRSWCHRHTTSMINLLVAAHDSMDIRVCCRSVHVSMRAGEVNAICSFWGKLLPRLYTEVSQLDFWINACYNDGVTTQPPSVQLLFERTQHMISHLTHYSKLISLNSYTMWQLFRYPHILPIIVTYLAWTVTLCDSYSGVLTSYTL